MVDPTTSLKRLIGSAAPPLEKARGLRTVEDLLGFWPRRYTPYDSDLSTLREGEYAVVVARVRTANARPMKYRKGRILTVVAAGERGGELDITFFKPHGHEDRLVPGVRAVFAGQVSSFNGRMQLTHPGYELLDEGEDVDRGELVPIYTRVPRLQNWTIMRSVETVLDALDELPDPIPAPVRAARDLPSRLVATRMLHQPRTRGGVEAGRRRMRYEEAFVLQSALAMRRLDGSREATAPRVARPGGLLEAFDARMPFELTEGQRAVGEQIAADLARDVPMHRLLQGEVGSGKTVVALRAMLAVVDSGAQAAILAPTEVLAAQHHRSITTMLGDLAEGGLLGGSDIGTRVALLTGSQSTKARRAALLQAASGEAGLVVGTHALLEASVQFAELGLVVVDEQHRFGVEQRDVLRSKAQQPPHVLVMTATPIPRTVAMTVFGDMETSTLRELPRGRAPITTHVVPEHLPGWMPRTWQRVAEEVAGGGRVYVVCPRIHEDDGAADGADGADLVEEGPPPDADDEPEQWEAPGAEDRPARPPLKSVLRVAAELAENPDLRGVRLGVLHGQLPPEEKEAVMGAFARGDLDVLVSTTVIEVGVDVPEATAMVILDADRFGVSQLHQLRGRVGRGGRPGLCLLVTGTDNEQTRERLEAVAATTDGFRLARLDLTLRREGDILGARQSGGRGSLRFLSLLRDEELVVMAHEDAFAVVAQDPSLAAHPDLAVAVAERLDEEQAAYLERS
ncbi:ATP-dependent DNA helicase recG [Nostocoides japonicum T1-X7]|uniref:ATP-dependent DNA helicase recG n=1 Tax=Nostocoides japonicum T1-X7 TaxID=1194083 RepID=A0A077M0S3_9MICO|nr:ATP-dependent DNA helicase RecG [Tetrasphaera japonica]CCH79918.1 ATP-dependent DNA helicase recG [Tetrasphaera japonica T1-X7]